jgi:hypothetical protein
MRVELYARAPFSTSITRARHILAERLAVRTSYGSVHEGWPEALVIDKCAGLSGDNPQSSHLHHQRRADYSGRENGTPPIKGKVRSGGFALEWSKESSLGELT